MLFEELLILLVGVIAIVFIGIPGYKLYRSVFPRTRDTLKEAKQRLEQARVDIEAAKLDRETQQIYNQMVDQVLEDEDLESFNITKVESRKL